MLYSARHNAVVYDTPIAARIVASIEGARRLADQKVVIPADLHSLQVARYLGLEVPSIIQRTYDWPRNRRTIPQPFDHQREMASFLTMHPRAINLSDIGTGKTMGTLWAADFLMSLGAVRKALVIAPLSTLKRVWEDEIFQHFMGRRSAAILYGSRETRLGLLDRDVDFYIINYEGLSVGHGSGRGGKLGPVAQAIADRDDIDMVIIDEGSAYKNPGTTRYKATKKAIEAKKYIWVLTGTPTPNHPLDAWGVADIAGVASCSHAAFKDRTMMKMTQFKWMPKPGSQQAAHELMQPSIRFNRDECIDLPPCMVMTRDVELSPHQKQSLDAMKKNLQLEMKSGKMINAVNEAALRLKLIQISLGAVYGEDREIEKIDAAPRLAVLREILAETQGKVLVFAPLTSVIQMLIKELSDEKVAMVNGEVSANKRAEIFKQFQQGDAIRIIVADPRTMAHGLTLTAAATIVWYGPTDQPEIYTQANGRINRPGQKSSMLIVRLAATPIEREIYKRLHEKQTMQDVILQLASERE